MSTAVFIPPPGTGFPVSRSPVFATTVQASISGKETRVALQSAPRWKYEMSLNVLRSSAAFESTEFQYIVGFFNKLLGSFDSFLYSDPDDNAVTGQAIGTGDGSTTAFQLIRAFGGFIEPMLAPNTGATINIYLNGVKQTSGYTVSGWGTSTPGMLTFVSAPGSGVAITADFTYYFPCRMSDDNLPLSLIFAQTYEAKKFSFISIK